MGSSLCRNVVSSGYVRITIYGKLFNLSLGHQPSIVHRFYLDHGSVWIIGLKFSP